MGFDIQNFGMGLLAGWASAYGVYRARHLINRAAQSVSQGATSAQNYATQSADNRYINDLLKLAEHNHLAGRFVKLSDILVEPRFIAAPPLLAPPEDDVVYDVFRVVPQVHDFPYLHAPYNLETLALDDLATGERALALLGRPGSGRTTALMTIALRSLGQVRFEKLPDKVQQQLDAEEAKMEAHERAVRIKDRLTMEQRAKERLAEERGVSFDADADAQTRAALPLFNRLMPVYVHLSDIHVRDAELAGEVDPAEPLVRAVQRQVSRVTASTLSRNLYRRLAQGQVLLLVDGYDDLAENERSQQLAWLQALMNAYRGNFFIVVGPAEGYGALLRLGLTPVFLRPWSELDTHRAVDRWAEAWPKLGKSRRAQNAKPDAATITLNKTRNRALSPFDLTLKVWGNYAKDAEVSGFEGWLRAYLGRHLPPDQSLGLILPQLAQTGALQLDEGYITLERLEAVMAGKPVAPAAAAPQPDLPASDAKGKKAKAEKEDASAQAKWLAMLRRSGLLTTYVAGRYQFRHPFVAAYLASLTLTDQPDRLAEKTQQPAWEQALGYAAQHTAIDAAVRVRMNAPSDVLHNHALEIANWLPYAGADAPWREPYLKYLANLLLTAGQYPLVRERVAAALVSTRDQRAVAVFRQALRSPDTQTRCLACLGIGALGDEESIEAVAGLLQDKDADVQLAAAMGLGAINTEAALTALVEIFTEGAEGLRQAIAETLAAIPDEGYPVLYDAIQDREMMVRRAAVFGLRRVKTDWALVAIYRTFLEDEQWYVRSAAQMAFEEVYYRHVRGPVAYPPAHTLDWLANWAAGRGVNIPPGEGANQVLLRALQEGEPAVRGYAASNLGQMGIAAMLRPLYGALRDKTPEVRDIAYRALANLQLQMGQSLPSPA
jgi:HEAT repeat protein